MIYWKELIIKMEFERDSYYSDLHDKCKRCMFYHATLTMKDGSTLDGIIENVDNDRIIVLVGEDVMEPDDDNENDNHRQYGRRRYPRRRFRRFRRQAFPLATLAALSLLPYPYVAPPYPYYNPYYPFYPGY